MSPIKITTCATALASAILLILSPASSLAQGTPLPPVPGPSVPPEMASCVIVVTGQGSVDATPDGATVGFDVQTFRPTAKEAQDLSSAVMDRVLRQVMALGIPREKIRTTAVSLFPIRKPIPGSTEVSGYQAINRITVTVEDLNVTGRVIDTAVAAGANSVESLTFGLRDPSPYRARAFRTAVENARATATAIASAAGVSNLRLVRIDEVGPIVSPRVAAPGVQSANTPVMPGELSVTVQVRAVYAF